jgi:hypothetical protein
MDLNADGKAGLLLLAGAALFELGREIREATPPTKELREADEHTRLEYLQDLLDGQAHTGIIVAGAALLTAWAFDSLTPSLILLGTFGALVWYQHSILSAPAVSNY